MFLTQYRIVWDSFWCVFLVLLELVQVITFTEYIPLPPPNLPPSLGPLSCDCMLTSSLRCHSWQACHFSLWLSKCIQVHSPKVKTVWCPLSLPLYPIHDHLTFGAKEWSALEKALLILGEGGGGAGQLQWTPQNSLVSGNVFKSSSLR